MRMTCAQKSISNVTLTPCVNAVAVNVYIRRQVTLSYSSCAASAADRYPSLDAVCPTCGQPFPEAASIPQPGEEPDGFDDPDNAVVDDRENMFELLK